MTNNVKAFLTDVNRDGFHEVAEAILASGGKDAEHISYDNTESGLEAENVQAAIDEVAGDVGDLVTAVNNISGDVDDLETAVSGISGDVSDLQTAVSGKVSKSGDTMTGKLTVNNDVEITGDLIAPYANIGTLNYRDPLTDKLLNVIAPSAINNGGTLQFPDKGGTLATMSDIPDMQLQNMITAASVPSGTTVTANLLSGFSLADYNMINIIVYDNNWVRGSAFVTRNPINNLFNTIIPCMSGGSAKDMPVKQNSNTQLEFQNNVGIALTVIVRGTKGF